MYCHGIISNVSHFQQQGKGLTGNIPHWKLNYKPFDYIGSHARSFSGQRFTDKLTEVEHVSTTLASWDQIIYSFF